MINELVSATVPCLQVAEMKLNDGDFIGFPQVQDANAVVPAETVLHRLKSFAHTSNGITIFVLIGIVTISMICNLVTFMCFMKARSMHRFMKSEIEKLIEELDGYDKKKKTENNPERKKEDGGEKKEDNGEKKENNQDQKEVSGEKVKISIVSDTDINHSKVVFSKEN